MQTIEILGTFVLTSRFRTDKLPIIATSYKDARLKIKRAKKHIADFTAAIVALEDTCIATVEEHARGGQSLRYEIPEVESALEGLSLIAGDALHNLHSALDFAWYSTIERCLPDWLTDNTKFPVRDTRQNLEATLHGIEADTRCPGLFECVMTHIQPYREGNSSMIWTLHDLDISDKHLLLLRLDPISHAAGISVRDANGELHHGATMATKGSPFFIDFYPGLKVEDKGRLSIAVTFQEAGTLQSVPAEILLSDLANMTFYSLQLLEKV